MQEVHVGKTGQKPFAGIFGSVEKEPERVRSKAMIDYMNEQFFARVSVSYLLVKLVDMFQSMDMDLFHT